MKLPGINKGQKGNHALYSAKNSLFEDSGISEARQLSMAHQNSLNIYEGGTPGVGPANSDMKGVTPKRRAGILKHTTVKPLEVESQMSSMTQLSPGPASALY